jgi:PIN domain nuclease of toxin-antitoxin system
VRYLADTHALIWWLNDDKLLSITARALMSNHTHEVFVSAASAWEITTKHRLGKLPEAAHLAVDVEGTVKRERFSPLPVTMAQAELAGRLKGAHRDPFDRMLMAQALTERLILLSNESAFDAFGISREW